MRKIKCDDKVFGNRVLDLYEEIDKHWFPGLNQIMLASNNEVLVAGGFVRDFIARKTPNDLDIFVRDREFSNLLLKCAKNLNLNCERICMNGYYEQGNDKSNTKIQIIDVAEFLKYKMALFQQTLINHIKQFNFRANALAWDGQQIIEVVKGAIDDCVKLKMVINNRKKYNIDTALKFEKRGWDIKY